MIKITNKIIENEMKTRLELPVLVAVTVACFFITLLLVAPVALLAQCVFGLFGLDFAFWQSYAIVFLLILDLILSLKIEEL